MREGGKEGQRRQHEHAREERALEGGRGGRGSGKERRQADGRRWRRIRSQDETLKRRLSVRVSYRFHPLETPPEQFRGDETRFFSILLNLMPCHQFCLCDILFNADETPIKSTPSVLKFKSS